MSSRRPDEIAAEVEEVADIAENTKTAAGINVAAGQEISIPENISSNLIRRQFVMQWGASLDEMERMPSNATWAVDEDKADIFRSRTRWGPNCEKSSERQGDLSRVCLVGMKITKVDSTFPCTLAVCIAGARGNMYSNSGEQFSLLVSPNEKQHSMSKVVVTPNPYMNSAYMQLYPGHTSKNLREKGIMKVPGENYCFVDQHHPIVEMMAENSETLQISMDDAELIDGRWIKVSQAIADRCIDNLENQLTDYLPVTDLTQFAATLHRMHGASWNDPTEVCDNITQSAIRARMMGQRRRCTICCEMTYSFL